jgi:glycosyltransferase involved in cell wall biosynthesis
MSMNRSARVLLVSKPVTPPWNDSSKNLVRDLAVNMQRYCPVVLSKPGFQLDLDSVEVDAIYPAKRAGRFAPALMDNARVMVHLLTRRKIDLWHFFFAPNRRTSRFARVASRLRGVPTIQTICSAPSPELAIKPLLFADRTVVLSKQTEQRLLESGVDPKSVTRIPPAVRTPPLPSERQKENARERFGLPSERLLMVYPGDLEFSRGAEQAVYALADLPREIDAHLAMACRAKTSLAHEKERQLKDRIHGLGLDASVTWVGETTEIHALLGIADLVLLPSETLYAKMDLPLVLIEAMALQRSVLVLKGTAAAELAENRAALAVDPARESVSEATRYLLINSDERQSMGERASSLVKERFDPRSAAAAYEGVYDQVINS